MGQPRTELYDRARKSRPVIVGPYQAAWPDEFIRLGQRLRATLGSAALRIDHVGSTSVPDLAAKDVIDIQVTVARLPDEQILDALRAAGFRPRDQLEYDSYVGLEGVRSAELAKHYAREPEGERRTHIHIRQQGNLNQRYALLFRDYLRASLTTRRAYAISKFRLAEIFPQSIDGYLYIKDPLMDIIFEAATLWATAVAWQPDNEYL
jgi:GrpB-like predicted nucleotidyltransferase (UPF0157 family)